MNKLLPFILITVSLTSCVSKKKYAALEAELEQSRSLESVNQSLQSRLKANEEGQRIEMEEMRKQLAEAHKAMKELAMQQQVRERSALTPEEQATMERERQRQHELEMLDRHKNPGNPELDGVVTKSQIDVRMLKSALDGALESYDTPKVIVEQLGSRLVVTVQDNVLFSSDKSGISASGETFISRLSSALKIENELQYSIIGISDGTSKQERAEALKKSEVLAEKLNALPEISKKAPLIGTQDCDHSFSERKTSCDRVELVFEPNYEKIMRSMIPGQR